MSATFRAPGSSCATRARGGARPIDRRPTEREPDTFVDEIAEDTAVDAEPEASESAAGGDGERIAELERANEALGRLLSEAEHHGREALLARERELVRLRGELAAEREAVEQLREEAEELREEVDETGAQLRARDETVAALREDLEAARELARQARVALVEERERHGDELAALRRDYERAAAADHARFDAELAALAEQCDTELKALEEQQEGELALVLSTHQHELGELEAKRRREKLEADKRAAAALAAQYLLFAQLWRG